MSQVTTSSHQNRLGLFLRRDLTFHPQSFRGQRHWVVKDPVSLRYFKFNQEEWAILKMLDGQLSLNDIKAQFERDYAPRRIPLSRLQSFLAELHQNGLLLSDGPQQGQQLLSRHLRHQRREGAAAVSNILALRLPGMDPEPLLNWLYPKLKFCFRPWFLAGCLLLVLVALGLVLVQADELRTRLPSFREFISASNVMWLAVVLAITKILHELGHALTCKHYGGECHEMGVMLLVFTPCLYCNVTDSWILSSRWQRIAITAAGIFVEIILASIATLLWWYSRPGLINAICLNVMVVCALGTLLANGNPLLRYDGYFILSDLLDVPNLWQDSRTTLRRYLGKWLLGMRPSELVEDKQQGILILYGVASTLYRVGITLAILYLLYQVLAPARLQSLVYVMVATLATGLLVRFLKTARQALEDPLMTRRLQPGRVALTLCAVGVLLYGFFLVPLPCRVSAPVVLEPTAAQRVYATARGTLIGSVSVGEEVSRSQTLAQLQDLDLQKKIARLTGDLQRLRVRIKNLESRAIGDDQALAQLPAAREMLADLQQQLAQRQREEQGLILKAPVAGTVLAIPEVEQIRGKGLLPRWSGTPLDDQNRNCTLERGTLVCLVGDPTCHEAVLFIDEADIGLVRSKQPVRMSFAVAPGSFLSGTIYEIAGRESQAVPRELAAGGEVANRRDATGVLRPLTTTYEARVKLDDQALSLVSAAPGRAKIVVDAQTIFQRFYRVLRKTLTVPI